MDLKNILPLLMANNKSQDRNSPADLLAKLAPDFSNRPEASLIKTLAQNMGSKKQRAKGLGPIAPFCADDILGKLTKYFS